MSTKLVTVAKFETGSEAHVARLHLEGAGIRAAVTGDSLVDSLWYLGAAVGSVKLQVSAENRERAEAILNGVDVEEKGAPHSEWVCECGATVDAGFSICWSCGTHFDAAKHATPTKAIPVEADVGEDFASNEARDAMVWPSDDMNPYRSGAAQASAKRAEEAFLDTMDVDVDELVLRAWRTSVFGLFLLPVLLHLYSMYLLFRASFAGAPMEGVTRLRFMCAWGINILVGVLFATLVYQLNA